MAKIIAWVIVILVVLLALRIVNLRKARARRARDNAAQPGSARVPAEPMVRCLRCGVYLPRGEAKAVRGGYACTVGECASHA